MGRWLPLRGSVLGGNFVRKVEQFDRSIHVGRLPEVNADPAALGKDVVGFGAASRHQLISDFFRKRNVHKTITMDMADFSPFEAIFCPSEAVGARSHVPPTLHGVINSFFRSGDGHTYPRRYTVPSSCLTSFDANGREAATNSGNQKRLRGRSRR